MPIAAVFRAIHVRDISLGVFKNNWAAVAKKSFLAINANYACHHQFNLLSITDAIAEVLFFVFGTFGHFWYLEVLDIYHEAAMPYLLLMSRQGTWP